MRMFKRGAEGEVEEEEVVEGEERGYPEYDEEVKKCFFSLS